MMDDKAPVIPEREAVRWQLVICGDIACGRVCIGL